MLALLALLLLVFGFAQPGFMTPDALADSTFNFSEKGILALALALLIIAGEIDLSIAAILALCSLAMGYAMKAGAGEWAKHGQTTAQDCGLGLGNDDIDLVINAIDKKLQDSFPIVR